MFANVLGRSIEVSNLTHRYFRPLLEKAGLPVIRFHDLRHTAATAFSFWYGVLLLSFSAQPSFFAMMKPRLLEGH